MSQVSLMMAVLALLTSVPVSAQQSADGFYQRSNELRTAGKLAEALAAMDRAIALSPNNSEYFRARASLKLALKDLDGVEADARQAVAIQPGNARAWNLLGNAKQQRKDYAGAIADYDKAMAADPAYLAPLINKGVTYTLTNQLEEAEGILKAVLARQPNTALAYNRLGYIALRRKEYGKAVEQFSKAIELDATDHQSFNSRGVARVELKQYPAAKADFESSLRIRPGFESAETNLQKLVAVAGRSAPAASAGAASAPAASRPPQASGDEQGALAFVHRANFFRMTCNGSVRLEGAGGGSLNVEIPTAGLARYGFPVQWSGSEFFYSGPSFEFDPKRYPAGWVGGNANLSRGSHLLLGKVSADGNRLLSLRLLTRGEDGHTFAVELREIDLRNRKDTFDDSTLFLSNYSQQPAYSKASEMFQSTVRLLDNNGKWQSAATGGKDFGLANVAEYRPFSVSVSLFQDPVVPRDTLSKEPLAAVRERLDSFWKRPGGWARLEALSDAKLASMFPGTAGRR